MSRRSTPPGQHRPVLLREVLAALDPQAGQVALDCTVGWAGHAAPLLARLGPAGRLLGLDLDADNLTQAEPRLRDVGFPYSLHHRNFAAALPVLQGEGVERADLVLADLGFASMQVDDPARGFSYRRDGPLDMRLDRSRGRTAAQVLQTISADDLARALKELADEPNAVAVARAIVKGRQERPLETTTQLAQLLMSTTGREDWRLQRRPGVWELHPAARTFQALRILVNRELANLEQLLRVLPDILKPGGVAAVISFHSGEDRLVKTSFRDGARAGVYQRVSAEPVQATREEKFDNPRARSAKLRWAQLSSEAKTLRP